MLPTVRVNANYECSYDFKQSTIFGTNSENKILKVNTDAKTFDISSFYAGLNNPNFEVIDKYADKKYTDEYLITNYLQEKYCPDKVYACTGIRQQASRYLLIINPSLITKFEDTNNNSFKGSKFAGGWMFYPNRCDVAILNEKKSTGEKLEIEFECDFYNDLYNGTETEEGLADLKCNSKSKSCSIQETQLYKEKKNKLFEYCKSIMSFSDYVNPCVEACSGLNDDLALIEDFSGNNDCGFSDKLILWIENILKWIKYILPVIVIIFSIVEFIKAMASDKEDEMKKAEKHFVTRLIAAALTFIVPLLIVFILEKMGYSTDSCGLFK